MILSTVLSMEEQYSILIALQENLPDTYSDENLALLEQLVTRYKEILDHVYQEADPDNNTAFYRENVHVIEEELKNAKYGHTEKQRASAYQHAVAYTNKAIAALLFHLNDQVK